MYKSHVVHVPSGEPPNSVSRPVPKKKAGVVKPITQGKLLRAGGPSVSIRWFLKFRQLVIDCRVVLETNQRLKAQACCSAITGEDRHICASKAQRHLDVDDQTHHEQQCKSPTSAAANSTARTTPSTCRTGCRIVQS